METNTEFKKMFKWRNYCKVMGYYRRSLNLTKEKLAYSLGVTPAIVGYWESGIKEPKISNFMNLTRVLGVSETEFLHPTDEVKEKMKAMNLV